jgi:hypothetical protein
MNDEQDALAARIAAALTSPQKSTVNKKPSLAEMEASWEKARQASLEKELRLLRERDQLLRQRMIEREARAEERRLRLKAEREAEREAEKAKKELSRAQAKEASAEEKHRLKQWQERRKSRAALCAANAKHYANSPLAVAYAGFANTLKALKPMEVPIEELEVAHLWRALSAEDKKGLYDHVVEHGGGHDVFVTGWWEDPANTNPPTEAERQEIKANCLID